MVCFPPAITPSLTPPYLLVSARYNFASSSWLQVNAAGRVPRARYRATCVVHSGCMYLFGGHDGTRHLNDVHVFDFDVRGERD